MIWICLCFADSPEYLIYDGMGCAYFDDPEDVFFKPICINM